MHFEYLEPSTVDEAVSLLAKYGDQAKVLAGGTDLVVSMQEQTITPKYIVSIERIADLNYISHDAKQGLRIGAMTTIRDIEQSPQLQPRYCIICQAAEQLADIAVRNMATIGGNLCNAAPSADMVPPLMALSANIKLVGSTGQRKVTLENFFVGPYQTVVKTGELLVEISVPALPVHTGGVYLKHMIKGAGGLGSVGVAVVLTLDSRNRACVDAKVALGAVAQTTMRVPGAEAILKGEKITQKLMERAAQIASSEARPRDSLRGSAEYKRELVKVLTVDAIGLATEQAKGDV